MEKLSQILWRERELLDLLLFRIEAERLVLAGGRTRWLLRAAADVEEVLGALRRTELLRAVAADEAAAGLGLAPNPSLRALAEAGEEPWRSLLLDHDRALRALAAELDTRAGSGERVPAGERPGPGAVRTVRSAYDGRSRTPGAATGVQPSLRDFLR